MRRTLTPLRLKIDASIDPPAVAPAPTIVGISR
jgi:hypothetical protein